MQIQSGLRVQNSFKLNSCENNKQLISSNVNFKSNDTLETKSFIHINDLKGNFNNQIKLVFSDIDQTIRVCSEEYNNTPKSSLIALQKLKTANIPLVYSTGRDYTDTKNIVKEFGDKRAYFILLQGAEIVSPNEEIIYSDSISSQNTLKLIEEFKKVKKENNLNSDIFLFAQGKVFAEEEKDKKNPKIHDNTNEIVYVESFDGLLNTRNLGAAKVLIQEFDHEKKELIYKSLKEKFRDLNVVISAWFLCEIFNKTVSKGEALKILAKQLDIDLKNIAALGDADNDYEMLKTVQEAGGLAVAMGNSSQKVLDAIKFRTDKVDNDGFKNAIDAILQNNSRLENTDKKHSFVDLVKNLILNLFK